MEGETFADFFKRNERRIHHHIHDLGIRDDRHEFYVAGVYALWKWWKIDQVSEGFIGLDADSMIRILLMELYERKQM